MCYRSLVLRVLSLAAVLWSVACGSSATESSGYERHDAASEGSALEGGLSRDATLDAHDAAPKLNPQDSGPAKTCQAKTCADLHATCGQQGDGCGDTLHCGGCKAPETCGGGGRANQCGASAGSGDGSTPVPQGTLSIAPLDQVIVVAHGQQAPQVTYSAMVGSQSVAASFSIDLGQIASVDPSTGVVTPSGKIGGVANVTASFGSQSVSTSLTVTVALQENGAPQSGDAGAGGYGGVGGSPAGGPVGVSDQSTLQGASTPDSTCAWLYPYDKTVWPQGILPPLLQWSTSLLYDAVYIQLSETGFVYQGFFSAPAAGQPFVNVPIQQTAWDTLLYSNQGTPVTVTLVFEAGGVAYGPLVETWIVAQGTLTGTVYYNSYGTALAVNYPNSTPGYPSFGGATLAIRHGATSPELVAGSNGGLAQCRVCHSVAAGGSVLITQHGDAYNQSSAYALTAGNAETVMPAPPPASYAFPAISPDGTFLLSDVGPISGVSEAAGTSGLFSVPSGASLTSFGLPAAGLGAAMPAFSPDGKHVAFNDYGLDAVSLGSIDFEQTTVTFSNLQVIDTPASGTRDYFPAFLPTSDAVVFEREVGAPSPDEFGVTRDGARGELWWVDLGTHTAAALANLNGVGYLPAGAANHADDTTLQYEPTVNPVPSGGYAWVVFTSRRMYGSVATQEPFLSDPRNYNASLSATTKKLWVAAIDLNAAPGTDPSHPAFYLPAQELLAGNSRGYWVVDPCEPSGASCLTGDQCCTGYCGEGDGGMVCGTQPPGCAVLGNKCATSSDCCGASTGISCIDGYCAEPGHTQDAGGCVPTTCAKLGIDCGPAGNGCGGLLQCGTCTAPETCGGGGVSGVCGQPKGPS